MVRRSGKERSGKECRPSQQFPSEVLHNKPQLFKEAMRSDDSCWHEAMKVEMNSTTGVTGRELCDLPAGREALTLKWKLKRRTKADGSIERYTIGRDL